MDCSLSADEERRFVAWLHSPSVYGPDREELILAWKIARQCKAVPSRALRALRGAAGADPELAARLERFVEQEPGLTFVAEPPQRRVALAGRAPGRG